MTHFYRFRSTDKLLGEFAELQNQSIYFAAPHELNDPMEGLTRLFWLGDAVVWECFLKHYVGCLARAVVLHSILGESNAITWDHLPLWGPEQGPPTEMQRITDTLTRDFLASQVIEQLIKHLASRSRGISEDELHTHLRWIYPAAIEAIRTPFVTRGFLPELQSGPGTEEFRMAALERHFDTIFSALGTMEADGDSNSKKTEALFLAIGTTSEQLDLISRLQIDIDNRPNFCFVYIDFNRSYLRQIRKLVHPDWYTACFTDSFHNSSVWGHYADGHRGVCLKFRTTPTDEFDFLQLTAPSAANGDGPVWIRSSFPFKKIDYAGGDIRMNFFTSLGRLSIPSLRNSWYTSLAGTPSNLISEVFDAEEQWRDSYWRTFDGSTTTKLVDWACEREHRLTFWSSINDISQPQMRVLRYDFHDLEGIIFGIEASEADKVRIIRIIEKKCMDTGRTDFKFYQAYQANEPQRIEARELRLIKFKP